MNLFGFTPDFFAHIEEDFKGFLDKNIHNPKAELFIPYVVNNLIIAGGAMLSVATVATLAGIERRPDGARRVLVEPIGSEGAGWPAAGMTVTSPPGMLPMTSTS